MSIAGHSRLNRLELTGIATAVLEIAGRVVFGQGFTSKFLRPRKYYTIPRETIESILEDIGQLFDFLLIEFQRTLFAENIAYTVSVRMNSLDPH